MGCEWNMFMSGPSGVIIFMARKSSLFGKIHRTHRTSGGCSNHGADETLTEGQISSSSWRECHCGVKTSWNQQTRNSSHNATTRHSTCGNGEANIGDTLGRTNKFK